MAAEDWLPQTLSPKASEGSSNNAEDERLGGWIQKESIPQKAELHLLVPSTDENSNAKHET